MTVPAIQKESPAPPLCVDIKAAAELIGISVWTLRTYIDDGLIPTVKFPSSKHPGEQSRMVRIAVADLKAFVDRCRQEAP